MFGARRASFGAFATTYDAARPEWPSATVTWMLGSPTAGTVCRVVDLGAGDWQGDTCDRRPRARRHRRRGFGRMRDALTASLRALPAVVAGRITIVAGGAADIPIHPERDRFLCRGPCIGSTSGRRSRDGRDPDDDAPLPAPSTPSFQKGAFRRAPRRSAPAPGRAAAAYGRGHRRSR